MSAVSSGVQTITPQTGTSSQTTPTQQSNKREADSAPIEIQQSSPPPPPPGQGKYVDKYV
jgi:hypothetical protein